MERGERENKIQERDHARSFQVDQLRKMNCQQLKPVYSGTSRMLKGGWATSLSLTFLICTIESATQGNKKCL